MRKMTPCKAIRLKCLDCSTGSSNEVKLCVIPDCPLYPYRFGKNPAYKGKGGKGHPESLAKYRKEQEKAP